MTAPSPRLPFDERYQQIAHDAALACLNELPEVKSVMLVGDFGRHNDGVPAGIWVGRNGADMALEELHGMCEQLRRALELTVNRYSAVANGLRDTAIESYKHLQEMHDAKADEGGEK